MGRKRKDRSIFVAAREDLTAVALELMDNRIVEDTKYQYGNRIKAMKKWFQEEKVDKGFLGVFQEDGEFVLPMSTEFVTQFFAHLSTKFECLDAVIEDLNNDIDEAEERAVKEHKKQNKKKKKPKAAYSVSAIGGFRSALVNYHIKRNARLEPDCELAVKQMLEGHARKVAELKASGKMELREGKARLLLEGYSIIAEALMSLKPSVVVKETPTQKKGGGFRKHAFREGTWMQSIFSWCFFTLGWSMMCRSVTTAETLLTQVSWWIDCMRVEGLKTKGDQFGEKGHPRHVYANPLKPSDCPILALAVKTFCESCRNMESSSNIFDGDFQEDRFAHLLQTALSKLPEQCVKKLTHVGAVEDIGTHSLRKGSVSYVLSLIGGPSVIQVFLRACWSLGNVLDRYIFADAGGDQFVGRAATGMPMTDSSFATLPPHLKPADFVQISEHGWSNLLPGYEHYPACFQGVIPYLFASIVYHEEFLRQNLDAQHPLFSTTIFTRGYVEKYRNRILVGEWKCEESGMVATGVPHSILILARMDRCDAKQDQHTKKLEQLQTDMANYIDQRMSDLPSQVAREILKTVHVEGAVPLTEEGVLKMMGSMEKKLHEDVGEMFEKLSRQISSINPATVRESVTSEHTARTGTVQLNTVGVCSEFDTFSWANPRYAKMKDQPTWHPVPKGFVLPKSNVFDGWMFWHFGNSRYETGNPPIVKKIAPYSQMVQMDLDLKSEAQQLSRMKVVMEQVDAVAYEQGHIPQGVRICTLSFTEASTVFQQTFPRLIQSLYGESGGKRLGSQSIKTLYELQLKTKKTLLQAQLDPMVPSESIEVQLEI